jgi:hypothetical protein
MPINAKSNGKVRDLIPAGNYIARAYNMVHIGHIEENIMGQTKLLNKVRIGWELPTELKEFDKAKGLQPLVISKEFTLSLHEKSNLRKLLASWRGKDFSEEEAKSFDITKLLGAACMLNIIHKPGKSDPSKMYEEIGSISPMPKGVKCPEQVNKTFLLDYDNFTTEAFETLPEFIKEKIVRSKEYKKIGTKKAELMTEHIPDNLPEGVEELPF